MHGDSNDHDTLCMNLIEVPYGLNALIGACCPPCHIDASHASPEAICLHDDTPNVALFNNCNSDHDFAAHDHRAVCIPVVAIGPYSTSVLPLV